MYSVNVKNDINDLLGGNMPHEMGPNEKMSHVVRITAASTRNIEAAASPWSNMAKDTLSLVEKVSVEARIIHTDTMIVPCLDIVGELNNSDDKDITNLDHISVLLSMSSKLHIFLAECKRDRAI